MTTWVQAFADGDLYIDTPTIEREARQGMDALIAHAAEIDKIMDMDGQFVRRLTNGICNVTYAAKNRARQDMADADSEITDRRHDRSDAGVHSKEYIWEVSDTQTQDLAAQWAEANRREQVWDAFHTIAADIMEEATGDIWKPYNPRTNRRGPTAAEAVHGLHKAEMSRKDGITLLVCGGRDIDQGNPDVVNNLFKQLDRALTKIENKGEKIIRLIHGGSKGADWLAGQWAKARGIRYEVFKAQWDAHGKKAGWIRNVQMADENPHYCVAFPGGKGTDMMVGICEERGIPVWRAPTA